MKNKEKSNTKLYLPALPGCWENFLLSLLFHMLLPLLPIGLEMWQTGTVSVKSLTLVAALYSISIGVSSRSKFLFGITIVVSIIFSVAYGLAAGGQTSLPNSEIYAWASIALIFITHMGERWNIHIAEEEPYWVFKQ